MEAEYHIRDHVVEVLQRFGRASHAFYIQDKGHPGTIIVTPEGAFKIVVEKVSEHIVTIIEQSQGGEM